MYAELIDAGENMKLEFLASEAIILPVRTKSASFYLFIASRREGSLIGITCDLLSFCVFFGFGSIFRRDGSALFDDVLSFCIVIFDFILETKELTTTNRRAIIF